MSTPSTTTSSGSPPALTAAVGASLDAQAAAFAAEPRIHFSTVTRRWAFEDDDGNEWEYETAKAAWVPVVDEELLRKQQAAYAVAGVDEEATPVLKRQNKKRKEPEDYTSATAPQAGPSIKRGKGTKDVPAPAPGATPRKSKNTAVYVTRLPLDTSADELAARFTKCGVLEEDDDGDPKVKLYARDDGTFSGEALVVYYKEESVALAVAMLDEAELRFGDPSTTMSVSQALFAHKTESGAPGAGGEEHKPRKTVNKKRTTKRLGRMQKKLEDWGSDDEFGTVSRHICLRLNNSKKTQSLLLDLKEDVREECSTLGEVTNVVLYDVKEEPEGIMTVKFRDPISAQACVLVRFFDGQRVEASLYNGKYRFRRSGARDEVQDEGDAGEKKRLDEFANWLLTEGD
ncbi:hypothetical protein DFH11DRAFT_1540309 [Phellopilus nigrolimitatus]|nr:hypothetical protein DFH11DRAFT_1540309 [Phellopilus nigrolimitatus]